MEYNEPRDADDKPRLSEAGTDGAAGCWKKVSKGWMTVGRKRQTELQSCAAVITQKTFNGVWFLLFKGVLWSGCAGYNCCLKPALRCNINCTLRKKPHKLELLISLMFRVPDGELTEGMWVGKADLNFMDWTDQKYETLNHSGGVIESYECVFSCSLISALQFLSCEVLFTLSIYLLFSESSGLFFFFLHFSQYVSFY